MAFCIKCGSTIVDGVCPQCSASDSYKRMSDLMLDFADTISPEPIFDINDGVLVGYIGNVSDVVLPDAVKIIGDNAFRENRYMQMF